MNKFNVETPQSWKNNLYVKISSKEVQKAKHFKPVAVAIAVILTFALTTTAFAFIPMPDFFKSLFQGNDEYLNPHYTEKNIVLDSETNELEIICTGIMGDKHNLAINFVIKSKGDTTFDINNLYNFETSSFRFKNQKPSNNDGYSSTFGLNYYNEKTLLGNLYISGNSGNGFTGKKLKIELKNLEYLKPVDNAVFERVLDCKFESEITVNYKDTSKRLLPAKAEISYNDIILTPVSSEISNISLNAEFKTVKGNAKDLEETYPFDTITVFFKDGTVSKYNLNKKTESQNIFYVNSVTQAETSYIISGVLGEAIDASKVLSVKFNDIESFAE